MCVFGVLSFKVKLLFKFFFNSINELRISSIPKKSVFACILCSNAISGNIKTSAAFGLDASIILGIKLIETACS